MNLLIQESNRCHECKKLFCCVTCRELHEKRKHPRLKTDTDCRLCLSQKLPLNKFTDPEFLCHLVIRHLPLICVLCGQLYRSSADLENIAKCESWQRKNWNSLRRDSFKKLSVQATPSPIIRTLSCPVSCRKQSISNDSEFHTLQSFASPPELMRNTSTPMHVGTSGQRSDSQFKTPKVPAVLQFKTPKTPSILANNKSASVNLTSANYETTDDHPSPTFFYSATSQQLINSKEMNSDSSATGSGNQASGSRSFISGDTPSRSTTNFRPSVEEGSGYSREFFVRTNSGRILEAMEEQEEQTSVDMDLTEAQDHLSGVAQRQQNSVDPLTIPSTGPKDLPKRVRFSDQHQIVADSTIDHVSDSEEFYEAPEIPTESKPIVNDGDDAKMMRENEDNSDKENLASPEESQVFQTPASNVTPGATSSRVVMMVVVENGFNVSSSNLVPLINSNLKKLQQSSMVQSIASSISGMSSPLQTTPNGIVRSVSSVDSYTASSSIDYYSAPKTNSPVPQVQTSGAPSGNGAGGILSAMAQAMRYAFRGLPGAAPPKSSPPRGRGYDSLRSSASGSDLRTSPGSSFSTIATSLLRRPGKRSRDLLTDPVTAHRLELRTSRNETGSPLAKRPRSWHRIRGRDPIARMRRDNPSPATRGVSSETQHFQQGSLSVGDTVLPIPSRAHQSTQTD